MRRTVLWLAGLAPLLLMLLTAQIDLKSPRLMAREVIALRDIQSINQAQGRHLSQNQRYAGSLSELDFKGDVASGQQSGYLFSITSTAQGYIIRAKPKVFGKTGRRTLYSDETNVVHQNWGPEPAGPQSPELK